MRLMMSGGLCQNDEYSLGSQLSTLMTSKMVQQMVVLSAHLCRPKSYPLPLRRVTWIKTRREGGVKSGRSGALKPDRRGLSCKANKRSNGGTGDLGVITTHESSLMKMTTWLNPLRMNATTSTGK